MLNDHHGFYGPFGYTIVATDIAANAKTGGVAPLRHDLARDTYIQKRKAQRAAAQQIRVTPSLAGVSRYFAGIAQWFTYRPLRRFISADHKTSFPE